MAEHGFIREKQDIEYLILYALSCLSEPLLHDELAEICMIDGGFGYFDFSDALSELVRQKNVEVNGERYIISDAGRTASKILSGSLPYHIRERAKRAAAYVEARVRRTGVVRTERIRHEDGNMTLKMSCVDGDATVYSFEIMVSDSEQASAFERNFLNNAEKMYEGFLCVLLNDYGTTDEE